MRNTVMALVAAATLALFATPAFATTTYNTTITKVWVTETQLFINLASGETGESCTDNSWATIDKATSNWQQLLNLALTGYLSNRSATVRINGCSSGYPKVTYINLQ